MHALARHHRRSRVLGAVLVGVLGVLLARPAPAWGDIRTVEVADTDAGSFTPASRRVHVGDTVRWVWTADESHTVTFDDPDHRDWNGRCLLVESFRCEGHEHEVTFTEVGEYAYRDTVPGSTSEGVVVVVEKPDETTAPPKPTPSPDPTTEPEPSETTESEPEPTEEPSPTESEATPAPEPEPEPEPEPPPPPAPGTAAPPAVGDGASPTEVDTTADEPTVAGADSPSPVPEPTFEDFPEAADPTPGDVEGEVALGLPDDGGDDASRTVWGVLGGATLLGTLGAFGRRVLFAEPWDA